LNSESIKSQFGDLELHIDEENKKITVPLSFSVMFKKISWKDVNKSVKILMTCISRVSDRGFDNLFDMKDKDLINDLLFDIEEVNFRVNDELVEDRYSRDAFGDLKINDEQGKTKISEGVSQVSRLVLDSVNLDVSAENQARFPIDTAIIRLSFDFYPIKMLMVKN